MFQSQGLSGRIGAGERGNLKLEKTNDGFIASISTDSGEESLFFPGCDFLLKQDKKAIYVGFAVAGNMKINVTDVIFTTSPGKKSHTPEGTINKRIPDYPFSRDLLDRLEPYSGGDPVDLVTAVNNAAPGCEIVLPDGVYNSGTYYVPAGQSGTANDPIILRAEHPGKAIFEGSSSKVRLPAFILQGSHWILDGLVFRNSPSCGLFVCGSYNTVRNCKAFGNGDTGFLVCSFPGAPKSDWPSRNKFESCVSHDNCDEVRCNADGFGAKLSIGGGNGFYHCKAFHNIDDGFDLYTKSSIGPIGAVVLQNCEAWSNGWLSDGIRPSGEPRTGVGFKLGGEGQRVRHQVMGCVANDNARAGFDANSNPEIVLRDCEASGNGVDFYIPSKPESVFFYRLTVPIFNWFQKIKKRMRLSLMRLKSNDKDDQAVLKDFEGLIPNLSLYSRNQVLSQLCRQALSHGFGSLKEYYNEVASNPEALDQLTVNLTFSGSHLSKNIRSD